MPHKRGLVHRDVKPANILIDMEGRPYVADFGLALREEDFGKGLRFAGTPAYMSPEQARGEGHRVDGRSDIFSLGIVFYELLTGRRPFRGESREEMLEHIISTEPRPLRMIDDAIPRELERICLKALGKRASERYTTAADLAEDLRLFLKEGGPFPASKEPWRPNPEPATTPAPSRDACVGPAAGAGGSQGLALVRRRRRRFLSRAAARPTRPRRLAGRTPLLEDRRRGAGRANAALRSAWSTALRAAASRRSSRRSAPAVLGGRGRHLRGSDRRRHGIAPPQSRRHALRRTCRPISSLAETLAAIRRGRGLPPGKKLLLVLDQFEQWLHGDRYDEEGELARALRQCDGERLQCLLLVRDDFWMAVGRFMKELEIEILEGHNAQAVDLFPPRHARKILTAYGRALEALPDVPGELSAEQASLPRPGRRGAGPGRQGLSRSHGPLRGDGEGPALGASYPASHRRHRRRRCHIPGGDLRRRDRPARTSSPSRSRPGGPESAVAWRRGAISRGTCDPARSFLGRRATQVVRRSSSGSCAYWMASFD